MKELTLDATIENILVVTEFVDRELEANGCAMKSQLQIDVAIDEIFCNIASYAYGDEVGSATVRFAIEGEPPSAVITFMDRGVPYDPLAKEDPDITLSAEERGIGGLGIFMVKNTMDQVEYRYEDGRNILTLRKALQE